MAAANTDYFTKVGSPGQATTMSAPGHSIGGTSINVDSTSLWPTDTGVIFAIDTTTLVSGVETRVAGTYTVWEGVVSSATSVGSMVLLSGTDQNYAAGATTRVYILPTSARENRMVDGLLVSHNQDGTLADGAVDDVAVLADNVVETAKIKDSNVTTAKIADSSVTLAKINGGTTAGVLKTDTSGAISSGLTVTSFTNTGTATGTFYYTNFGGMKMLWGTGATAYSIPSGIGNKASQTIVMPTGFFTTVSSVSVAVTQLTGDGRQGPGDWSVSGDTLSVGAENLVATGVGGKISVFVVGI